MAFELLPNEVILDIFDYVITSYSSIHVRMSMICHISLCCKLFHNIIHMQPIMKCVREYKLHNNFDALKIMNLYSRSILMGFRMVNVNKIIADKISLYNNEYHSQHAITAEYSLANLIKISGKLKHIPMEKVCPYAITLVRPFRSFGWTWMLSISFSAPYSPIDINLVLFGYRNKKPESLFEYDLRRNKPYRDKHIKFMKELVSDFGAYSGYIDPVILLAKDIEKSLIY